MCKPEHKQKKRKRDGYHYLLTSGNVTKTIPNCFFSINLTLTQNYIMFFTKILLIQPQAYAVTASYIFFMSYKIFHWSSITSIKHHFNVYIFHIADNTYNQSSGTIFLNSFYWQAEIDDFK